LLVKPKNTHFVSVLFFVSYFLVAEIGENATDARRDEHVSPNCTSVREASARRSNDADGVLSPIGLPNTVVKPIRRKYLVGNGLGG